MMTYPMQVIHVASSSDSDASDRPKASSLSFLVSIIGMTFSLDFESTDLIDDKPSDWRHRRQHGVEQADDDA